ncbi:MAG: protein-disulfide reductase DsbD family protein [Pirellulaceae bacterium]
MVCVFSHPELFNYRDMLNKHFPSRWVGFLTLLVSLLLTNFSVAQVDLSSPLGVGFGANDNADDFQATADFKMDSSASRKGKLSIHATLSEGWHIYSITQPPGGPLPTKIKVKNEDGIVVGEFLPDVDPHVVDPDPVFGSRVESFEHEVTWTAPIEIPEGTNPDGYKIDVAMTGQRCVDGVCLQIDEKLTATFKGYEVKQDTNAKFVPEKGHVLFSAKTDKAAVAPGEALKFSITAEPQDGYHIYGLESGPSEGTSSMPTLVVFTKLGEWSVSEPVVQGETVEAKDGDRTILEHKQPVTWVYTLTAPKAAKAGEAQRIAAELAFQTCTDSTCDMPSSVKFDFEVPIAAESSDGVIAAVFANGSSYNSVVENQAKYAESRKEGGAWKNYSASFVLPMAFLAGLILNIMPCVLPVIGIKIMSFVNQAGSKPGHLIMLNVFFTLGILAVFMVLATLAVFFGFGWGDLYKNPVFTIVMVSVLFTFALSFVGVWEIPLPGFVGTAGGSAQSKEGFSGAFVKGIFSTLLATPCSGPMLVPAVVWAIAQPPFVTYLVFAAMGLGMASPYLVLGMFPGLAKMLPRPGGWMETFKVLMGFLLLGAVVFFVGSVSKKFQVSTLALLVFLGMACWLIGRVPAVAAQGKKVKAWGTATAITLLGVFISFYVLIPQHELEWEPYSEATLQSYLAEGRPVFVDATADWCFTCKTNEFTSFNRKKTKQFFEENNIVALKADNTEESKEINRFLDQFGNTAHGLPYYAVYHPEKDEPLHFGAQTFTGPEHFINTIKPGLGGKPDVVASNEAASDSPDQNVSANQVDDASSDSLSALPPPPPSSDGASY